MAKIKFREVKLSMANIERLRLINSIIEEYQEDNLVLTLRQLYYQLVIRNVIPNKQTEYSKLSTLLKEGRMGGIVDWSAIEDRLRKPYTPASFENPREGMEALIDQYQLPRMKGQKHYIEVWVEKDALSGVLSRVTKKYHVPILVNRGYSSASSMYDSYTRFKEFADELEDGEEGAIIVLYLGDFDPSGVDMIRDIKQRIEEFSKKHYRKFPFNIIPIALTQEQIKTYNPPPNPAKVSDPRAKKFIQQFGGTSWEVDALPPKVLNELLERNIEKYIDMDLYAEVLEQEKDDRLILKNIKSKL